MLSRVFLILLIVPGFLTAQPQVLWEDCRMVSHIKAFDVSDDGRYVVVVEPGNRAGDLLLVLDRTTNKMLKYRPSGDIEYSEVHFVDSETVRLSSVFGFAEFDLGSRQWLSQYVNDDALDKCTTGGILRQYNPSTEVFMLHEYFCDPPRTRVYDASDFQQIVDVRVPAPFKYAAPGRTAEEVIFYGESGLGLGPDKMIEPLDSGYTDWVHVLGNDVYTLFRTGYGDTSWLCRVDVDNATILASVPWTADNGNARVEALPDPTQIHIHSNRYSPVVDRYTFDSLYVSPTRVHQPMIKRGDRYYVVEIGRHLYELSDPAVLGDTVIYKQRVTQTATVDHLDRIIIGDDTIKTVDPSSGRQRVLRTGSTLSPWHGNLIADRTAGTLISLGPGQEYSGDDFQIRGVGFRIELNSLSDTSFSRQPVIQIDRGVGRYTSWFIYSVHGFPIGYTPWTCESQDGRNCFPIDSLNGKRFSMLGFDDPDTSVVELLGSAGTIGYLVGDSTIHAAPMVRVGNEYILHNQRTRQVELRSLEGALVEVLELGSTVKPLSASDRTLQVLCWRPSDKSLCLFDLPSRSITWSQDVWDEPTAAVMDPDGRWFFAAYQYGRQHVFEVKPTSITERAGVELTVYPNPTTGMVHIRAGDIVGWQVHDAVGRVVASGSGSVADLQELPSSLYYMRVQTRQFIEAIAVSVQR